MNVDEAITEIQQSRSEFQLRHFVIGQHDTPEMQFYQCCLELESLRHNIRYAQLNRKKIEAEIAKLQWTTQTDPEFWEAEIKKLELERQSVIEVGANREYAILCKIFSEMVHYTRDEIEKAQPHHWKLRLTRQYQLQRAQAALGVSWGQLDAMNQAGFLDEICNATPPSVGEIVA